MDAGASVVAFIGLGLTSIKTVFQAVSSIKDGPKKLQDLTAALANLQAAYEHLSEAQGRPAVFAQAPQFSQLLSRCNEDVIRLELKLRKLKVVAGESLHGILWKKAKLYLADNDLVNAYNIINHHVGALSLEVDIIQTRLGQQTADCMQEILNASRAQAAESAAYTTLLSTMVGQNQAHEVIMRQNGDALDDLLSNSHHHATLLEQHSTIIGDVRSRIDEQSASIEQHGHISIETHEQTGHILERVEDLATKTGCLQSLSIQQNNDIQEKLLLLSQEISKISLASVATPSPVEKRKGFEASHSAGVASEADHDLNLILGLQRLCNLVDEKEHTLGIDSKQAEEISEDLDTLLQYVIDANQRHDQRQNDSGTRADFRGLKTLRGALTSTPTLSLNRELERAPLPPGNSFVARIHDNRTYQSQHGILTIRTTTGRQRYKDKEQQEYTAAAVFQPSSAYSRHIIKVAIRREQNALGFLLLAPSISISRTVPRDSKVFQCVKMGLMEEFLRLLQDGKASLRDRDERGASLLHHAYKQPEMTQFLIEHGADVDDCADCSLMDLRWVGPTVTHASAKTPLQLSFAGIDEKPLYQCFEHLLAAGADPTIETNSIAALSRVFLERPFSWAKAVLRFRDIFFDIDYRGPDGDTLLHVACMNFKAEHIHCLIQLGADVNARNDRGQSCLHLLVKSFRGLKWRGAARPWYLSQREIVLYLIQSGAGIHSQDNMGQTISDTAYSNDKLGSYAGDLWDSILAELGYSIEEFRKHYPRQPKYVHLDSDDRPTYTRENFERLWSGNAHLCPYYDDEILGVINPVYYTYQSRYLGFDLVEMSSGSDADESEGSGSENEEEEENARSDLDNEELSEEQSDNSDEPEVKSLPTLNKNGPEISSRLWRYAQDDPAGALATSHDAETPSSVVSSVSPVSSLHDKPSICGPGNTLAEEAGMYFNPWVDHL